MKKSETFGKTPEFVPIDSMINTKILRKLLNHLKTSMTMNCHMHLCSNLRSRYHCIEIHSLFTSESSHLLRYQLITIYQQNLVLHKEIYPPNLIAFSACTEVPHTYFFWQQLLCTLLFLCRVHQAFP